VKVGVIVPPSAALFRDAAPELTPRAGVPEYASKLVYVSPLIPVKVGPQPLSAEPA
jgi:hypothetical protein